jgi:hypothetical protein
MFGHGEMKLDGLGSTSGSRQCSSTQDQGLEAAGAADDGEQWWRRRFSEELRSGEEVAVDREPLRGLSRSGSSYYVCLKSKRGTTRANWSWQHRRKAW